MSADSNGQGGRGWVSPFTELFAEVFASSRRIPASRYSVYNAMLGVDAFSPPP
jgi:hypothetical protein